MDDLPWKTLSQPSQHKTCAVAVCKTPHPPETSLHKFPKDPDLRRKWIQACKRKDAFNAQSAIICSRHFSPDCFERDLRSELLHKKKARILKPGSIPTINLAPPSTTGADTEEVSSRQHRREKREQKEVATALLQEACALERGKNAETRENISDREESDGQASDEMVQDGRTADGRTVDGQTADRRTVVREDATEKRKKEDDDNESFFGDGLSWDPGTENAEMKKVNSTSTQVSPHMQDKQIQCNEFQESAVLKLKIKKLQMQLSREKKKKNPVALSQRTRKTIAREILSTTTDLSKQQINIFLTGKKKTHWKAEDIIIGLTLRSLSRKAYDFLRRKQILPLPSLTTLQRYVRSFACKPGLQKDVIQGKTDVFTIFDSSQLHRSEVSGIKLPSK